MSERVWVNQALTGACGTEHVYEGLLRLWVKRAKGWGPGECSNLTVGPLVGVMPVMVGGA